MKRKVLFIQTAFIGDAILISSALETWHKHFPDDNIYLLVKKGNESVYDNHPFLKEVWTFDKNRKWKDLLSLMKLIRGHSFDLVFNFHRFFTSGLLAVLSGAKHVTGFDKNPLSFLYTHRIRHSLSSGIHEIERNHRLLQVFVEGPAEKPKIYPSLLDEEVVSEYKHRKPYVTIAPGSVWETKKLPEEKWLKLLQCIPGHIFIYFIGSKSEIKLADVLIKKSKKQNVKNLCGQLSLLQSAALMESAVMNYVNDSAPLHLASAVNAPVTAFYCSTVPEFGFYPLSDKSIVKQTKEKLSCRPCGLHGRKHCPEGHFLCGKNIMIECDEILDELGE